MIILPSKNVLDALVALHNLGAALEASRDLLPDAAGFPVTYPTPTAYVTERLRDLANELCPLVERAVLAQEKARGDR